MLEDQFCKRLTELRMKKGVSARDMSLSIGQSAGYINNIENGKNFPSMMGFFYICEYLDVSPEEFFSFEVENPVKTSEITESLKSLDDKKLDIISAIIESWEG